MAIKPICDSCNKELMEPGALLFAPPSTTNVTKKYHICCDCYFNVRYEFIDKYPKDEAVMRTKRLKSVDLTEVYDKREGDYVAISAWVHDYEIVCYGNSDKEVREKAKEKGFEHPVILGLTGMDQLRA